MHEVLDLDGESLSLESVFRVARREVREVRLTEAAREKCRASQRVIQKILESNQVVYGVNTGFGSLASVKISNENLAQLQVNLIHSHAVGVGEEFSDEIVRMILVIRLNTIAKGCSGIRLELIDRLVTLLNRDILPCIPCQGSLGASGDLAPLAHLSLVLLGLGEARIGGERVSGAEALKRAGLEPIVLEPKEGLALINGTQVSTAVACEAARRGMQLVQSATFAAALSTEVLQGTDTAFHPRIQQVRAHRGQGRVAWYLLRLMEGSEIRDSHRECTKVQDPYSIRCIPQVHGACLDAIEHAARTLEIEINSCTDNPMVIDGEIMNGGNFHAEPVGMVMDYLAVALCELGAISERRVARLVNGHLSGLPPFLARESGLNSGMMISHYTSAALVMENRILAHPATVDSLPTSADQEDHVSMATVAARKAVQVAGNLANVLSIELLTAAQAAEFLRPLKPGRGTFEAYEAIRRISAPLDTDRVLAGEIRALAATLLDGSLPSAVARSVGLEPVAARFWD